MNDNTFFGIVTIDSELIMHQTKDKILACNKDTEKYGLILNEHQALALSQTHKTALKDNKRIEFRGGIVDKLILAFCNSPYIYIVDYEDTIHELINLFYDLKNNTWDTISDSDLIELMKDAFDNYCFGSLDLLNDVVFRLSEHIHCGGTIKNFEIKED